MEEEAVRLNGCVCLAGKEANMRSVTPCCIVCL